ncbi:hypothetical protein QEP15_16025 [Achromobacter mucicolens]|nr:hypothetical protein [Achromobacter mucicolens]WGJ88863.1 hypothetical protein QEP15_16025 [Achromobacter mucicolens]
MHIQRHVVVRGKVRSGNDDAGLMALPEKMIVISRPAEMAAPLAVLLYARC